MTELTGAESEAVENFLKTVYTLQQSLSSSKDRVSTNALAEALGRKAPSITDMARRMVDAGLIHYRKYQGVRLTEQGELIALQVIRRHRLIELYLVEHLAYQLHEVHDEAERLEHAVSERFISAIADKLGNPDLDPHGDPIPTADGTMKTRDLIPLAELEPNTPAKVSRFNATSSEMLQYILDRNFRLDIEVIVKSRDPFEGPITVDVDGHQRVIGYNVASSILVNVTDHDENFS